jgi:hypothetical protein
MNNAHTPGPWRTSKGRQGDMRVVQAYAPIGFIAKACNANDATLIASAPDLLAALGELIAEWDYRHADEDHRTGYTLDTNGVRMARAAIARATGGA